MAQPGLKLLLISDAEAVVGCSFTCNAIAPAPIGCILRATAGTSLNKLVETPLGHAEYFSTVPELMRRIFIGRRYRWSALHL